MRKTIFSGITTSSHYDYTQVEPHRYGSTPIAPPILCWHVVGLVPYNTATETRRQRLLAFQKVATMILKEWSDHSNSDAFGCLLESDNSTAYFEHETEEFFTLWRGFVVRISLSAKTDYATGTFTIELSRDPTDVFTSSEIYDHERRAGCRSWISESATDSRQRVCDALRELRDESQSQTPGSSGEEDPDKREAPTYIYERIWEEFRHDVIPVAIRMPNGEIEFGYPEQGHSSCGEIAASIVCDIRAVVLDPFDDETISSGAADYPYIPATDTTDAASECASNRELKHQLCLCLPKFWRLLDVSAGRSMRREAIACYVLAGRALFFSAIGSPSYRSAGVGERGRETHAPTYIAILSPHHEPWQLGRLLQRTISMEEYRTLALRSLKHFRQAGRDLRKLGIELDELADKLNRDTGPLDKLQQVSEDLRRWLIAYSRIGTIREIDRVGQPTETIFEGGLSYRVARSKIYTKMFRRLLRDQRFRRIETFQPYDEWARRRLFGVFDYIERVGERAEQLRDRADQLQSLLNTRVNLLNQSSIVDANESIKKTSRQSAAFQRSVHEFQFVVEIVAITYYGGSILGKLLQGFLNAEGKAADATSFVTMFIVAIWIAGWRKVGRAKKMENSGDDARAVD